MNSIIILTGFAVGWFLMEVWRKKVNASKNKITDKKHGIKAIIETIAFKRIFRVTTISLITLVSIDILALHLQAKKIMFFPHPIDTAVTDIGYAVYIILMSLLILITIYFLFIRGWILYIIRPLVYISQPALFFIPERKESVIEKPKEEPAPSLPTYSELWKEDNPKTDSSVSASGSALDILNKRYAGGEISGEEYRKIKRDIVS